MKTVPTLVASSTVGAAATGLVFAHPQDPSQPRPTSSKRKGPEYEERARRFSAPPSRPITSSAIVTPHRYFTGSAYHSGPWPFSEERPPTSRKETSKESRNGATNRQSNIVPNSSRDTSGSSGPFQPSHESRESTSNRSSWYKRLSSGRPLSQAGTRNHSPKSSVCPDSPSITFSQGSSAAPILSPGGDLSQLPPNKLVKPAPSHIDSDIATLTRNVSRSQVPTLRRPATSHQRSATLQQRFKLDELTAMRRPITQHTSPFTNQHLPPSLHAHPQTPTRWRLHFDARPTRSTRERTLGRTAGALSRTPSSGNKRILPDDTKRPMLIKPSMLSDEIVETVIEYYWLDKEDSPYLDSPLISPMNGESSMESTFPVNDSEPESSQKLPRRSLSMQFRSSPHWIRRSSSLRSNSFYQRSKTMDDEKTSPEVPLPEASINTEDEDIISSVPNDTQIRHQSIIRRRGVLTGRGGRSHPLALTASRSRQNSSPLPPVRQFSGFNIDFTVEPSASSSAMPAPSQISPTQTDFMSIASGSGQRSFPPISSPRLSSNGSRSINITPSDRGSTLVGSDFDGRGLASGDDEDIDFQSDTAFDSFRTGTTGGGRQSNPPLETMFDENPPATGLKAKIAPLQELMAAGVFRENDDRIMEEDEDMLTPVKHGRKSRNASSELMNADAFPSSPPVFEMPAGDFGRLSLDDEDEDEDWTKDEEDSAINSPLSPPSSSLSSNRVSPALRTALADLTNGGSLDRKQTMLKPKHSVFDWSEPSTEKLDFMGNSPRPKTAHAKQLTEVRGGRAIGRRGPSPLHVRSQSVPVVPDINVHRDATNISTKFGTWGLGAKGVSEDWDNDFEFDGMDIEEADEGTKRPNSLVMQIPKEIQESQANVVGHVSQIREICLLVEDLKRYRTLAREKGILHGPTSSLWKEAEGIIALAIPDEDDLTLSPPGSPTSTRLRGDSLDPQYSDWGVDAEDINRPDEPIEVLDGHGRPTGSLYDGKIVRRRSVLLPGDDIFGIEMVSDRRGSKDFLSSPGSATFPRAHSKDTTASIARSVMETMHQHRATSAPSPGAKMPFDTTSLRDLVGRAAALSRTLAEIIRKHDRMTSPNSSPKRERDVRPAFTRVFTDPLTTSPQRHLPRSQSNNSLLNGEFDNSPSRRLGQHLHMMTVV